jgi:hypothetical protein
MIFVFALQQTFTKRFRESGKVFTFAKTFLQISKFVKRETKLRKENVPTHLKNAVFD